jgi:hypothetical protein
VRIPNAAIIDQYQLKSLDSLIQIPAGTFSSVGALYTFECQELRKCLNNAVDP